MAAAQDGRPMAPWQMKKWQRLKVEVLRWLLGKWKQRPKPAGWPRLLNFEPHPNELLDILVVQSCGNKTTFSLTPKKGCVQADTV